MSANDQDQRAIIADQVKQHLPAMQDKPEEDWYAMIGKEMADVSATLPKEEVEQAGRDWFTKKIRKNPRLHTIICENIDNFREAAEKIITPESVTPVVVAIASILNLPAIAIPAAAIAVALLLIKIGLREYCQDSSPEE